MLYSMVPAAVLILNFIINWESLKNYGLTEGKHGRNKRVPVRFNNFVIAACCYFLVDMTWGLLYEHRDAKELFPAIYTLTVLYFLFMLLTMLSWTLYIVAYLDKGGRRSTLLLYGVWTMVSIGVICLGLNQFNHFMFSYNGAHEYVGEFGRNISFLLQISFYAVITVYMLCVAHKSMGRQKERYRVVAMTSIVLGGALVCQILNAFLPSYAIGLTIGICMVHSFVKSSESKEKQIHDHIASAMAEDYEAIFYIEIESGEYISFSKSQKYMTINATSTGKDFFKEAYDSID